VCAPAVTLGANSGRQPRATESLPEGQSVNGDGISGALIRAPSDCGKETVSVTPGNSGSHRGLGGEMVMHARALDAYLGRKVAKAEAPVSGVADMGLGQVHQSFSGLTHVRVEPVSIDR
jgi:hypothetical protein